MGNDIRVSQGGIPINPEVTAPPTTTDRLVSNQIGQLKGHANPDHVPDPGAAAASPYNETRLCLDEEGLKEFESTYKEIKEKYGQEAATQYAMGVFEMCQSGEVPSAGRLASYEIPKSVPIDSYTTADGKGGVMEGGDYRVTAREGQPIHIENKNSGKTTDLDPNDFPVGKSMIQLEDGLMLEVEVKEVNGEKQFASASLTSNIANETHTISKLTDKHVGNVETSSSEGGIVDMREFISKNPDKHFSINGEGQLVKGSSTAALADISAPDLRQALKDAGVDIPPKARNENPSSILDDLGDENEQFGEFLDEYRENARSEFKNAHPDATPSEIRDARKAADEKLLAELRSEPRTRDQSNGAIDGASTTKREADGDHSYEDPDNRITLSRDGRSLVIVDKATGEETKLKPGESTTLPNGTTVDFKHPHKANISSAQGGDVSLITSGQVREDFTDLTPQELGQQKAEEYFAEHPDETEAEFTFKDPETGIKYKVEACKTDDGVEIESLRTIDLPSVTTTYGAPARVI